MMDRLQTIAARGLAPPGCDIVAAARSRRRDAAPKNTLPMLAAGVPPEQYSITHVTEFILNTMMLNCGEYGTVSEKPQFKKNADNTHARHYSRPSASRGPRPEASYFLLSGCRVWVSDS